LKRTDRGLFQDMSRYSVRNTEERYEIFPSRKLITIPTLARKWFIANIELQTLCCASLPFCRVSHRLALVWFKSRRGTYCLTPVSMFFLGFVEEFWSEGQRQHIPRPNVQTFFLFNIRVDLPHFYPKFCI